MVDSPLHDALCLGCGYSLRGLPEPICPECARRFDPSDASTFTTERNARRSRRRRLIRRGATITIVALLAFWFIPRAVNRSTMRFRCQTCSETVTIHRWEAVPPSRWPARYPGIHWTSHDPPPANGAKEVPPCAVHAYGVKVNVDLRMGRCSGSCDPGLLFVAVINGQDATISSAAAILESMMDPSNNGITISSRPLAAGGE